MRALKKARKLIETQPDQPAAAILSALVVALEAEQPYAISDLYRLDYDTFQLALELLQEWRLDRYYTSKVRLLDLSVQLSDLKQAGAVPTEAAPGA